LTSARLFTFGAKRTAGGGALVKRLQIEQQIALSGSFVESSSSRALCIDLETLSKKRKNELGHEVAREPGGRENDEVMGL
jgi:hypothetical protein